MKAEKAILLLVHAECNAVLNIFQIVDVFLHACFMEVTLNIIQFVDVFLHAWFMEVALDILHIVDTF